MEACEAGIGARRHDAVDDVAPHVADGPEPEADVFPDGREVPDRLTDIRGQHLDAHSAALVQVHRHLVFRVADARQQRGHVLGRVMRLEVGGPVRDHAVRGRVGLVERVVREGQQDLPEHLDGGIRVPVRVHAGLEALELLVELGLLLLAHRAAEDVGLSEAEAGDPLGDRHHLLLVDDQAVARVEDVGERLGELLVDRRDLLLAVLAQRVVDVRVRAHGAWPVERDDGRDVFEVVGPQEPKERAHRPAVELEHPEGVAAREELVRRGVVQRQVFQDERVTAVGLDVVERVVDDREVAKPQEVHLDEAEGLARGIVELRDDLAVLLPLHDRDDVDERLARHDDAGGVHAPLALQVLEPDCRVEHGLGLGIGLDEGAELARLFESRVIPVEHALERHVLSHHGRRHRLGEALPHAEREAEHASGVLQRLLRLDGAVRDDLRDALVAVLLGDVLDHLGATAVVEVDVEVGHRDAVGVEEALEDEAVLQRVEIGDLHGVRGHRSRAGAAARDRPGCRCASPS